MNDVYLMNSEANDRNKNNNIFYCTKKMVAKLLKERKEKCIEPVSVPMMSVE